MLLFLRLLASTDAAGATASGATTAVGEFFVVEQDDVELDPVMRVQEDSPAELRCCCCCCCCCCDGDVSDESVPVDTPDEVMEQLELGLTADPPLTIPDDELALPPPLPVLPF